jgi:glutamate racemase
MNLRPVILVFDSGVGGLTVFREIVKARPDASYVLPTTPSFPMRGAARKNWSAALSH